MNCEYQNSLSPLLTFIRNPDPVFYVVLSRTLMFPSSFLTDPILQKKKNCSMIQIWEKFCKAPNFKAKWMLFGELGYDLFINLKENHFPPILLCNSTRSAHSLIRHVISSKAHMCNKMYGKKKIDWLILEYSF